jgi:sRNA-binding protein
MAKKPAKKPLKKTLVQEAAENLAAADALFRLQSRQLVREELETMTWSLWGNIRLSAHSLDSQRHCNEILLAMERAIGYVQGRMEEQAREHEVARREWAAEHAACEETIGNLKKTRRELRAEIKELKANGKSALPAGEPEGSRTAE